MLSASQIRDWNRQLNSYTVKKHTVIAYSVFEVVEHPLFRPLREKYFQELRIVVKLGVVEVEIWQAVHKIRHSFLVALVQKSDQKLWILPQDVQHLANQVHVADAKLVRGFDEVISFLEISSVRTLS